MCGKETEGDQQTITALYIQSPTNSRIHNIYTVYTTYTYTTTIYIPYTSSHRPTLGYTLHHSVHTHQQHTLFKHAVTDQLLDAQYIHTKYTGLIHPHQQYTLLKHPVTDQL